MFRATQNSDAGSAASAPIIDDPVFNGPVVVRDERLPARELAGITSVATTAERTINDMLVPPSLLDERGVLATGALAVLTDSTLGYAIMTTVPLERGMVTSHLHLDLLAPIEPGTPVLRGTGVRRAIDDRYGLADGVITGQDGTVHARGTIGAVIMEAFTAPTDALANATAHLTNESTRVPQHRLTAGSPVHATLGTQVVRAGRSGVRVLARASVRFANSRGGLHGGFGVLIGERTLDLALRVALGGARTMRPVELRAVFLRPIIANEAMVESRATVIHLGRRLATARGELRDQRGRPAVLVDATYLAD